MSSIIEGYNYDIFISYRQKDNKGDRWVSEFVESLKTELESTFKEEISVYFDINPHDGLLETHDVDESLQDKLKCLIFIPIISRTYCDPKSFAWEHEFRAFIYEASQDQFGLKVKLQGGNVGSRVLPIQIHELDADDKNLVEDEIGGHLRGIEFIYKESGVNRPLMVNEEHPDNNLNKTFYRNQINKVANAVKEIISAIKKQNQQPDKLIQEVFKPVTTPQMRKRTPIIIISVVALALIVLGLLFIPKLFKSSEEIDKSLAVLPFESLSNDKELQYQADGVMDAILLHLSKIKDLRVMSRTSVEQYRDTQKTIPEICSELGVAYVLEGSFQKSGDQIRLIVQLIQSGKEGHVWANNYDREWKEIFSVQSEVAQLVAGEIQSIITPEEMEIIEKAPTNNLDAYDYYLRASQMWHNFTTRNQGLENILQVLDQAIALDPDFAQAYALKGIVLYRMKSYGLPVGIWRDSALALAENAVRIDPDLSDGYILRGRINWEFGMMDEYRKDIQEAYRLAPGNADVLNYLGELYLNEGRYLEGASMRLRSGIISYNNREPIYYYWWGGALWAAGEYKKAEMLYEQAIKLDPGAYRFYRELGQLYMYSLGDYRKAIDYCLEALKIQPVSTWSITTIAWSYLMLGDLDGAEESFSRFYSAEAGFADSSQYIPFRHRLGYVKWLKGEKEEAMKLIQEEMKLDRETQEGKRVPGWLTGSYYYDLGEVYAFLGNREEALLCLDSASNFGFFNLWWAEHDPMLDSIRQEERFQNILSKQRDKETKMMNAHREVLNQPEFLNQIEWFFKKD